MDKLSTLVSTRHHVHNLNSRNNDFMAALVK